ncbi:hypothetical protein Ancab_034068 [Ancistrocladus abbreviatus]
MFGKVIDTDYVPDDHLLDERFLKVRVLINVFFVLKKALIVNDANGTDIVVFLKYECLSDFYFNYGQLSYKRESSFKETPRLGEGRWLHENGGVEEAQASRPPYGPYLSKP